MVNLKSGSSANQLVFRVLPFVSGRDSGIHGHLHGVIEVAARLNAFVEQPACLASMPEPPFCMM